MPTVLRPGPYRVYFYSHDLLNEPPHVPIDRDDLSAKFWLDPVSLARNLGFKPKELRAIERLLVENEAVHLAAWREHLGGGRETMNPGEKIVNAEVTEDELKVELIDGRTVTVPLAWYPRLLHASPEQRANWKIAGGGYGLHWPDIDEDLSSEGLLRGAPAPRHAVRT
jgi:hypothetical protein